MFDDLETKCRRILAPYAPTLAQIPRAAWDRFLQIPDRLALSDPSPRATIVNAYMIDEANAALLSLPNVLPVPNHRSTVYLIEDQIVVRFKYIDDDRLSKNYPTRRALDFNNPQGSLRGIPASAVRVDIGYQLNDVATLIDSVLVVRRSKKKVQFSFSLDSSPAVIAMPEQFTLDANDQPLPMIRARGEAADAANATERQATDDE